MPDIGDPLCAATVADAIIAAVAKPYEHEGHTLRLGTSVGIALAPAHGENVDDLLSCADLALYQAKSEGRHCYRLFTPLLREQAHRTHTLRDELGRAVENGEFVLFYQPQVQMRDGALTGAEALLRWQHPERGLLAPAAFLDVLDRSCYAAQVGDWVLRTACRQAVAWRAAGASRFRIGVNLCSAQVQRGDLAQTVKNVLAESGLPADGLELEITENIVLRHDAEIVAALRDLREAGVGIAFDDYGTGYASLSLLKRFPLTRLKIDRSFVTGKLSSHQDMTIVRAILQLGHGFKLAVIAEGSRPKWNRLASGRRAARRDRAIYSASRCRLTNLHSGLGWERGTNGRPHRLPVDGHGGTSQQSANRAAHSWDRAFRMTVHPLDTAGPTDRMGGRGNSDDEPLG